MGRSPCCDEDNLKKGPWTPEEDQLLIHYIQKHGHGSWRALPKLAGLRRCGKSCRLRWTNYLRPDIKRGKFSQEEENTILHLHSILGNKWSTIATHLPGRTDNEIKNYWNTHLRKRLLQMGIDPMTHQPRTDLFSCLPQLIALANLNQLLEDNQLAHNLQYLNQLLQPSLSFGNNTKLKTDPMDPTQTLGKNPYCHDIIPQELGQEMACYFPVENATVVSDQPLQQQVPIMNFPNIDDDEVVGQCQRRLMSEKSSSSSSAWTPLPPLMDTSISTTTNNGSSGENSGVGGGVSLSNWPDFLFEDSFLDENLREIC